MQCTSVDAIVKMPFSALTQFCLLKGTLISFQQKKRLTNFLLGNGVIGSMWFPAADIEVKSLTSFSSV